MSDALTELMATIERRKATASTESYTSQLLQSGVPAISAKVLEEARELIDAAESASAAPPAFDPASIVHEAADLVYHVSVLLAARNVTWDAVWAELRRRAGTSGLVEKASRNPERSS